MFATKQVIENLVVNLALQCSFDREGAHELLYHLGTPGRVVPSCIAEVMIEHPEVTDTPSHLPARLAFGLVDDALARFDLDMRKQRRDKFFRALNLVRISLQKEEFPDIAIIRSQEYHNRLLFAAEALKRLAEEETIFPLEASTLVEQMLNAHIEIHAVTELLLEIQIRRFTQRTRARLRQRVEDGLRDGVNEPPVADACIMSPATPVGFRLELKDHKNFNSSTEKLKDIFTTLC